jgi:type VI secretion system protein ImpB
VLAELNPKAKIAVENTLTGDGSDLPFDDGFKSMEEFNPAKVVERVLEVRVLMAARNLLHDLKLNLLANAMFRCERENILFDPTLFTSLRSEFRGVAESAPSPSPAQ